MAHELDTTDGHVSFASREDAWHRLGTVVGEAMDARQALSLANLAGWNVRKLPLTLHETVVDEDGVATHEVAVPDKFATVRTNPVNGGIDYLGVVGTQYVPIQNEEHVELFDTLVDESGAHYETAGALRGGREVFLTMKFPEHMMIGGVDPVSLNIAALNSHDGRSAFRFIVTPVRIVCANTQAAALGSAKAKFSIQHTTNAKSAMQQAREALGLTFKYAEAFEAEAERLIQESMTLREMERMLDDLWPVPKGLDEHSAQARRRRGDVMRLFEASDTNKEIRGTRWAGYQAITEYVDHFQPAGSGGHDWRAERSLTDVSMAIKSRAFDLVSA